MGKDSLLKSTSTQKTGPSKEKKARKKSSAPKATAATQKPKTKISAATRTSTRKAAAPGKKAATKKVAGVKARTTPRRAAQKAKPAARKDAGAVKLVLKQFDRWKPKKLFKVDPKGRRPKLPAPPPSISGANRAETERIRALLFKKFHPAAPAGPQKIRPAAKPGPDVKQEQPAAVLRTDPAVKTIIYLVAGFIVLLAMVIAASVSNRSNYYLKTADGAVEVWQGTFAPLGRERIIVLPGSQPPATASDVYTKNEIFSFVFSYYLEKADTLLDVTGMPDFEGIKLYLNMARSYAATEKQHAAADSRINAIDLMTYLYKADVAASKGTRKDYQDALDYLNKAATLKLDNSQAELVKKKIQSVKDLMAGLKAPAEKPPEKPVEIPSKQPAPPAKP